MKGPVNLPRPRARPIAPHRPELDPACAGCPQLGLLRGLRRCGIEAGGRLGCEPGRALLLADVTRGETRVRVLAGPAGPDPLLLPPGVPTVRLDPGDLPAVERALWRALTHPGDTLFLAITPCVLSAPRRPPLAVAEARCNRCGSCLTLGCPAIADPGGEVMAIDVDTCTGCGLCAPLCRARAIGPALRVLG
jgi:NAD-dependent dihydropyrimidine dehydrogenase PreA subunit